MATSDFSVAVVGPTGLAGREVVRELQNRRIAVGSLRLFGSTRTAGAQFVDAEVRRPIELLQTNALRENDLVIFAAGRAIADQYARATAADDTWVIDLSSALRFEGDVALVVPEVNAAALGASGARLVACPSPTTVALTVVLAPLMQQWSIRRAVGSTYQGLASAGTRAVQSLSRQTVRLLSGAAARRSDQPQPMAFNCIPEIGRLDEMGVSAHERQVAAEAERVLGPGLPSLMLTAVRVPIFVGTAISLVIESDGPMSAIDVSEALRNAPGVLLHEGEDPSPTPRDVAGSPATHVGRVREDPTVPHGVALWIAMDSLAKGRAVNAVQITELIARDHL